jgi:hypothetical protein
VQCWTSDHAILIFVFALPLFVLYVIGVPLAGLWLVIKNKLNIETLTLSNNEKDQLTEEEIQHFKEKTLGFSEDQLGELKDEAMKFQTNFGFLIAGYEPQYGWWECIVSLRKVAMSILSTILAQDYFSQGQLGLLVIVIALLGHTYAAPFKDHMMDIFEFMSLSCSGLIFFLGTLSYGPESEMYADYISAAAMLVMIVWFLTAIGFGVYVARTMHRAKEAAENVDAIHEDLKTYLSDVAGSDGKDRSVPEGARRKSRSGRAKRKSMQPNRTGSSAQSHAPAAAQAAKADEGIEMTERKTRGPTNRPDRDAVHTSQRPRHQSSIGALPPPPTSPRPRSQSSIGALPPPPTSQRPRRHTSGALGLDDIPLTMVDEHDSKHRSARPELSLDDAAAFYFCGLYLRRGLPVPLSGILAAVKTNGVDISSDDLLELLRASPSSFKELPHTKGNAKSGPRFRAVHIPLVVAQGPTSDRELSSQRSSFSVASN